MKQKTLHHEKTEVECNTESLALINLIKVYQKTLISLSKINENSIIKEENNIKDQQTVLQEMFKERGRDNYYTLMVDIQNSWSK